MALETGRSVFFHPTKIGQLEIANRFVKSATAEGLSTETGEITEKLIDFHAEIARGGIGLQFLGHAYVNRLGIRHAHQTSISEDRLVPMLKKLTSTVHSNGGLIFAQLAHAGAKNRVGRGPPAAPSRVVEPETGNLPREMTEEEILETIDDFGEGARRAVEAGFDGVHIHGANGYLISEFCSPYSNTRRDEWGGDEERRGRFLSEVYRAVREKVGGRFPVTLKVGAEDHLEGGLKVEESVRRVQRLEREGLDAIEVSCGVMPTPSSSTKEFVAVGRRRAIVDLVVPRLFHPQAAEGYFLPYSIAFKRGVGIPVILVGGLRKIETMAGILERREADLLAIGRPLFREPDLVKRIRDGKTGLVECTSCNLCLDLSSTYGVRCWRKSKPLLAKGVYLRTVMKLRGSRT